ncbi:unnamed protein product, partial [Symbiodinium necroappetens]
ATVQEPLWQSFAAETMILLACRARLESQGSSITGVTEKTELILMLEQLLRQSLEMRFTSRAWLCFALKDRLQSDVLV